MKTIGLALIATLGLTACTPTAQQTSNSQQSPYEQLAALLMARKQLSSPLFPVGATSSSLGSIGRRNPQSTRAGNRAIAMQEMLAAVEAELTVLRDQLPATKYLATYNRLELDDRTKGANRKGAPR
jgi:hypothetical protein